MKPRLEANLERVLREVRAVEPAAYEVEPCCDRLLAEFRAAALLGDLARPSTTRERASGRARAWIGALCGAAAIAAGVVLAVRSERAASSIDTSRDALLVSPLQNGLVHVDGDALLEGAHVVARERSVAVLHAHRAYWSLGPHSRAQLVSQRDGVVSLDLESGALEARVVPSTRPESFVVAARGTVVAVHGTHFTVSVGEDDRVAVRVSAGVVVVRPRLGGMATELGAGQKAEFLRGVVALPGAPAPEVGSPEPGASDSTGPASNTTRAEPVIKPPAAHTARSQSPRLAERDPAHAALSEQPDALVEHAVERVSETVQSCFRRHTSAPGELRIEVTTELSLAVEPDGHVLEARMNPPLAPQVEQCTASELQDLNLGATPEGFRLVRDIRANR